MKFVNCARHVEEQNMALVQDGYQLYYECCKDICAGDELLVWYGSCYSLLMGIPIGLNVYTLKNEVLPDPEFAGTLICTLTIHNDLENFRAHLSTMLLFPVRTRLFKIREYSMRLSRLLIVL